MAPEGIREPQKGLTPEGFRPTQESRPRIATDRARSDEATRVIADILDVPTGNSSPPIRSEKIALVRRRIAEGYYDRPEVKTQIAEQLLRNLGDPAQ